jgi:hypothetical protein
MNAPDGTLQRRYRRLLASYPRPFREEHGEELLAVLLDCAGDRQRYPRVRETADLITHGLLARLRSRQRDHSPVQEREVPWGDALASASVHGLGPAPGGSWIIPRWLKWVPVLIGVVAIVVSVPYVFFDHALAGYGGSGSATGTVGQTTYHGLPVRPAGGAPETTVNLRSVTPRIAVNTARATVTLVVCRGNAALVYGGTWHGDPAPYCARRSALHPGTIRLGTPDGAVNTTGVLVAVTPHRSGIVRIEGANVTYRQGIRYGHQHVGMEWTLRVP